MLGQECTISAYQHVSIGRECIIADRVMMIDFDHGVVEVERPIREQGIYKRDVEVGHNVWIGYGACVLRGVRVGDNAIVGTSSVLTADVPENTVVAGIPARVIRAREKPDDVPLDADGAARAGLPATLPGESRQLGSQVAKRLRELCPGQRPVKQLGVPGRSAAGVLVSHAVGDLKGPVAGLQGQELAPRPGRRGGAGRSDLQLGGPGQPRQVGDLRPAPRAQVAARAPAG